MSGQSKSESLSLPNKVATECMLVLFVLTVALISAEAQNTPEYFEVGGKLVLKPEPFSGPTRSFTWKLNGKIVGVLDEDQELVYYSAFRDRAQTCFNDNTSLTCTKESKSCSLSCGGDITEAGPVTFDFKKGDGDWEEGEKDITIVNDATTNAVETFSCRMKNPLGETDSESVDNPFYVGSNTGVIVGMVLGVLGVLLGGAAAGGAYYHRRADQPEEAPLLGQQP
uniref:Ig-like domain-containing protein n=1 Tax=Acanthochromis polyacanthus TaxID=80966 RepID=A0A3Q1GB11_9TELE